MICFSASCMLAALAACHAASQPITLLAASTSNRSARCSSGKLFDFVHRHLRQLRDLLHQIDVAHHQPHLGIFIFLAAVVGDAHEAFEAHLRFVLVGDAHVIGGSR